METKVESEIFIKNSFETILKLTNFSDVAINIPKYKITGAKGTIKKFEDGGLDITIENVRDTFTEPIDLEILVGDDTYYVYGLDILHRGSEVKKVKGQSRYLGTLRHKGYAGSMKININGEFKDPDTVYYRFITPTHKYRMMYYLETESFSDEEQRHLYGKFTFNVNDVEVNMYEVHFEEKFYFIIDSTSPITLDIYSKVCHSVMIGYGLLSATFHQNEAYYLTSRDADFKNISSMQYVQLRPTISSILNPIYSNTYGYTKDCEIIKKIGDKLPVVTPDFFSKLCSKVNTEEHFATLILLLLEANTASLILKPAGYSVALEKLTNIIVAENKGLKPINDNGVAGDLRKDLLEVLNSYAEKIAAFGNEDSFTILTKNIDNINSPTNRDKLLKPFGIYGIELNEYDIQAIDHRNNFLHGKHVSNEKKKPKTTNYLDVFHVSLRLNGLINRLIFKYLGYKGWLVNYVKLNEKQFKVPINEDLFIEV